MATRDVQIPSGVEARLEGRTVTVKGPKGQVSRDLFHPKVKVELLDDRFIVSSGSEHAGPKSLVGTFAAHLANMVAGATKGFHYLLKTKQTHFPMTVKVQGREVTIENILGERFPRRCGIVGSTKVTVKGAEVHVEGADREAVGQTAANIERMGLRNNNRNKRRDRRVFQDGIYIVEKG